MFVKGIFFMLPLQSQRTKFLKKHKILAEMGENCFFQPHKLPTDPKCIKFHNNVFVAADVTFINHDVIFLMLNHMDNERHCEHLDCIEVMDNCFLGLGSKIMGGVKIGPNAIVAAGSVVTKDVPPGTVVAGVPARVIGSFEDVVKKQAEESAQVKINDIFNQARIDQAWERYYEKHKSEGQK